MGVGGGWSEWENGVRGETGGGGRVQAVREGEGKSEENKGW